MTVALGVIFTVIAVGFFVTALRTSRENRTWRTAHAGEQEPPEIIAAVIVCSTVGHTEFMMPLIVVIMGAHFVPFAFANHRRFDFVPAIVAILAGIGGIIAAAQSADASHGGAIMGLCGACCTTMYGVFDFLVVRRLTVA